VWGRGEALKEAGLEKHGMCGFPRGLSTGRMVRALGGVAAKGAKPMTRPPMKRRPRAVKPKAYIGLPKPM